MDYIIGAGAILESGAAATITPATLHARVDPSIAARAAVAAVDFEGTSARTIARLLVLAQGWNSTRFRVQVSDKLKERRDCSLGDVLQMLASAAQAKEVHLFAHWLPDEDTCGQLGAAGIEIISHPLEAIEAAALVAGQRCRRWAAA